MDDIPKEWTPSRPSWLLLSIGPKAGSPVEPSSGSAWSRTPVQPFSSRWPATNHPPNLFERYRPLSDPVERPLGVTPWARSESKMAIDNKELSF